MKIKKIRAHAKINLGFNILEKQQNCAKHDFESIYIRVDNLYDEIEISESPKPYDIVTYFINDKEVLVYSRLIYKTLDYIRSQHFSKKYFMVKINKNIPIGSGLGGGSSDAAAVLRGVLEEHQLTSLNYYEIGTLLGADIPFFLSDYSSAFVTNLGTKLTDLGGFINFQYNVHILNINVNTQLIYQKYDQSNYQEDRNDYVKIIDQLRVGEIPDIIHNNLQEHCFDLYPAIRHRYCELSKDSNNLVLLSGSGSSLISINKFQNKE
ncbi:hypothetical protein OF376_02955 [Ureaplasma miroungigenitalium]|uniref:4-diphosphocytidyl-2-C-methyl-D-erythritol kinase n=1 Tax=Ureaplasma miroungigenitalium TaxID=1042321 RepID=A0ABT3BNQ2_9BACT|nr:hypothetical protein [Ureaplasma miroungigenitalium]MCV3728721.1 hypothetical protein [Ureaplasma miroungigenitalium]MCV3734485.1 hypothetical protein [Ureaplasma miroungigenitalium]